MKKIFILVLLASAWSAGAQELYVFTEPASNMPARTLTPRIKWTGGARPGAPVFQRYTPEVMLGISPEWMVHLATTFSNMHTPELRWEGIYSYAKFRFLSLDALHRHFRMAAFAEAGYSRNPLYYDEISVRGDNSGIDAGLIATGLLHKLAVSGTASYLKLFDGKLLHEGHPVAKKAMNYALSAGYLVLPYEYKSYEQLNLNLYAELLAQKIIGMDRYFIDLAPSIQFIFNSNSKLNLGYRFQLDGNALRSAQRSYLVSFEHTFFNVLKKRKR